jgi:hypothetical protein
MACASTAEVSMAPESSAVQTSGGGASGDRDGFLGIEPSGMPELEDAMTSESKVFSSPAAFATPAPAAMGVPAPADRSGRDDASTALQTAQRQVISTASITIEVAEVQFASGEVRRIAESLGGFVEQLSISGGSNSQQANITIRVPQDKFFIAVERLKDLGEVQNQNLGSEDVSDRFIDLKARLNSAEREERSLLSLLDKNLKVGEILSIERELSRIRSDIERFQGQLNFLERRVDLSTISVFLFPPTERVAQPPSGSLTVESSEVSARVTEIKNKVASLEGMVDRAFLSVRDGRERADISLRVFPEDFDETMKFLEETGVVRSKEVREGAAPREGETARAKEPNAQISISLVEPEESSNTGLIIGIAAPIGGILLAALLGFLSYRIGRRRVVPA